MKIKEILDEIASTSSTNEKVEILSKYKDNKLLERVLYLAYSKRVKFYIRQIPEYNNPILKENYSLIDAIKELEFLSDRTYTGHEGIEHLKNILSSLESNDVIVIERIIDKDLRIGMNRSLINRVFLKLIEKTPYMGAQSFSEKLAREIFKACEYAFSQVKMDGRYANAIIRSGEVELESRCGETTHVGNAKFLQELSQFDDCVLNGELTIDGVHRYIANGMVASIVDIEGKREERTLDETQKKIEQFEKRNDWKYEDAINNIRYTIWDMITTESYFEKKENSPYENRLERLENMISKFDCKMVKTIEYKKVSNYEEALIHFQEMLARGEEGTILKSFSGTWKDGKPNWQIKMKKIDYFDLKIIGFNYGTPGTKNEYLISSLNVESECGLLKTSPGGISEDDMKYITKNIDNLMGNIVEVKCNGLSKDKNGNYSLLHPVFIKIRDDKDSANTLNDCIKISEMLENLESK